MKIVLDPVRGCRQYELAMTNRTRPAAKQKLNPTVPRFEADSPSDMACTNFLMAVDEANEGRPLAEAIGAYGQNAADSADEQWGTHDAHCEAWGTYCMLVRDNFPTLEWF